jgi:glycosyltransferase involved in cell wall biosynthesis
MRILLSAYACEPNRGSEPGVGWEWATRLARSCDVFVLTRANNRKRIEASLGTEWHSGQPRFIYLDLPPRLIKLKNLGVLPVFLYYVLWQLAASRAIKSGAGQYDIIHHVTFNGFRFPGAWWSADTPVVLGPLGGGSITAPQFRRCYGSRWIIEKFREYSVRLWRWNPWTVASLNQARTVMVVGDDLLRRFRAAGIDAQMMLETALPRDLEPDPPLIPPDMKRDFIWVGNLEPWKAWQIALEAYSLAVSKDGTIGNLKIIGRGNQEASARKTAIILGIADRVDFISQQPRDEVWKLMASARALIFSSIRDTSGNVVIEAMGLRCPVICFQHQGVAMMTDDHCAFRVKPSDWHTSVEGFAEAIVSLAQDDSLVDAMGNAGRMRVKTEITWEAKVAEMLEIYSRARSI